MMRRLGLISSSPHLNLCRRGSKNYDWYYKQLQRDRDTASEMMALKDIPLLPPIASDSKKRPRVFFEFTQDEINLGKVTFELANDILPKTCTNFLNLCSTTEGLTYMGTIVHKIANTEYIQGGDVLMEEGLGTHSSYDSKVFKDEGFVISHRAGVLSMANSGV